MAGVMPFMVELFQLQAAFLAGDVATSRELLARLAAAGRVHPLDATIRLSTLTSAVTSDSKTYASDGSVALLIRRVSSVVQPVLINTETSAFGAIFGGSTTTLPSTFEDRLRIKAMNVRVESFATDSGGDLPVIDVKAGNPTLYDLHPQFGLPAEFDAPKLVSSNANLTMKLALVDTTAAIIGAAGTFYGLRIGGLKTLEG